MKRRRSTRSGRGVDYLGFHFYLTETGKVIVYSTETLDAPPVGEETAEAQVTALPEGVCGWQDRTGGDRAERGEF